MDDIGLERLIRESGFEHWGPLDPATLEFRQEVRDMCASGRCPGYGKRWTCPPACPSLETLRLRVAGYSKGILVQTVAALEDEFDGESMAAAELRHAEAFLKLSRGLRAQKKDILPMGVGACRRCAQCSYPAAPCRFPEEASPSLEACGILVTELCKKNGLPYRYGDLSITYTSCILY